MSEFVRRNIKEQDIDLFTKAVKLYFFVNHVRHDDLPDELQSRFPHCSNVIYSLIRGYMDQEKLQIEYLEFLNEEIVSWLKADSNLFNSFQIKPTEIDEIELGEKVPLQFHDGETGERLRIVYYPEQRLCDYAVLFTN